MTTPPTSSFLLNGIPLGRPRDVSGPNGVHGKDGGADKDGAHDHKVDVEDAVKVVAHLIEHGLQFQRHQSGQWL